MLPTTGRTLHVRSTRVVLDGAAREATLLVDEASGVVTAIDPADVPGEAHEVDVASGMLVPAPLDLHFHGAGGIVVPPEGDVLQLDKALSGAMASAGFTGISGNPVAYEWVATLPVPAIPPHDPVEHVAACAQAIAAAGNETRCRGIRIEGLFLNVTRAGVWPPETFHMPDASLLEQLHAAAHDAGSRLLVVDVAPELPGALEMIERGRGLGIVMSLAHSDATWEQARDAIDAGATLATHAWNAMRPVTHRDPGIVAAVLADPRVTCELICDGVHLHPGTIALSIAACGPGGWAAISDASPFAGCEPGDYEWAGTTVTHDGVALRDHAGRLAGSASLLDQGIRTLVASGVDPLDAALAAGAVPRRVLDPARPIGLVVGDPVWIVG